MKTKVVDRAPADYVSPPRKNINAMARDAERHMRQSRVPLPMPAAKKKREYT